MSARIPPADDDRLTPEEGQELLRLARRAIEEPERGPVDGPIQLRGLARRRGLFVTLRNRTGADVGALRGCMGSMEASMPLAVEIHRVATMAAHRDPRFPSLGPQERSTVHLSISVLGATRPIDDWRRIDVGRHGVELSLAPRRAVFLPQVAREQGWDREQLLVQLSRKAGLEDEAWRRAQLAVFETQGFEEPGAPLSPAVSSGA